MNDLAQIQTIDDCFREFSHFHVRKATELLRPLHTPGRDSLPDFSNATRQPFEGQAHIIAAAIKMLDETRGLIIAEPGAGKTLMGSGDTRPNSDPLADPRPGIEGRWLLRSTRGSGGSRDNSHSAAYLSYSARTTVCELSNLSACRF